MDTIIVWFRNDLRLRDQPALYQAVNRARSVLPVYIQDTHQYKWHAGAASQWWLHHSLQRLNEKLENAGNNLLIFQGDTEKHLQTLIEQTGASAIYCTRSYEPEMEIRDQQLQTLFTNQGIDFRIYPGNLLNEPEAISNKLGQAYKVFTPYYKEVLARGWSSTPLPSPRNIPRGNKNKIPNAVSLDHLKLLPAIPWYETLARHWQIGEDAADKVCKEFASPNILKHYIAYRDVPSIHGTSRLSPYIHFGEISVRVIAKHLQKQSSEGATAVLRQLIWRDFAHHIIHHFPETDLNAFQKKFNHFAWNKPDKAKLLAWKKGMTGIPIIDAGMRELWHTGWMHNRVRMLVASFLTKNLLIHWQYGAKWFWDTLVDADLAQNSMNWQWVAGSGVDAAPYFRIFNPVTQGEKFDKDGDYVKRWIPEISGLEKKWIHRPWQTPSEQLSLAGITLGKTYPYPIVDLKQTREEALYAYNSIK
jgi:deoxyribodipyrimidine photo-lyase